MSPAVHHCVIYRFRLRPGMESQYIGAWTAITKRLRDERGALGSRLHRGPDGLWYAYAQWPSADARAAAFAGPPVDAEAMQQMRDAIEESFPEIVLEMVSDLLVSADAQT